MRVHKLEAEFVIELRVDCAGEGVPPDTSVGEVGGQIEDAHITDLVYEQAKYDPESRTVKIIKSVSLFDAKSGDLAKFLARLEEHFAAEMNEALEESSL